MQPVDDNGRALDAAFSLELASDGFDILFESRGGADGGSTPSRNSEYARALLLLLERARTLGCVLIEVQLASRPVSTLPEVDRRLTAPGYSFPVDLRQVEDLEDLRRGLGRASAAFGRAPGKLGGNPTKRLRLRITAQTLAGRTAEEIAHALALPASSTGTAVERDASWTRAELHACVVAYRRLWLAQRDGDPMNKAALRREVVAGALRDRSEGAYEFRMQNISAVLEELGMDIVTGYLPRKNIGVAKVTLVTFINELWERDDRLEAPTADPVDLETRVAAALQKLKGMGKSTPPPGSSKVDRTAGTSSRFIRDPNVIAWVLEAAAGRCDVCGTSAPFFRSDGSPYLEVHHVRPLADGGPDTVDNALAGCPNCHRRLHHGSDRDRLRMQVIARIDRLVDYPKRTLNEPMPVPAVFWRANPTGPD